MVAWYMLTTRPAEVLNMLLQPEGIAVCAATTESGSRHRGMLGVLTLALAAVAAFAASPVSALPTYLAGVGCNGPFQSNQDSVPVASSCNVSGPGAFSPNTGSVHTTGSAFVGPGVMNLRSTADVGVVGARSGFSLVAAQAFGEWSFDDFVIVGTGPNSTPVLGSLNLQISGLLSVGVLSDRQGTLMTSGGANAQFFFDIELDGRQAGFGEVIRRNRDEVIQETVDGLLVGHYASGESVADSITSDQLLLPVGTSFRVHVFANAGANASGLTSGVPFDEFDSADVIAVSDSDFSATVKFPTVGPVFNLPPGYTVHSVSAGIRDNRFIVQQQVVPEPPSLLLLALGALCLLATSLARART